LLGETIHATTNISESSRDRIGRDPGDGNSRCADVEQHDGQDEGLFGGEEKRGRRLRQEDDERLRRPGEGSGRADLARYGRGQGRRPAPAEGSESPAGRRRQEARRARQGVQGLLGYHEAGLRRRIQRHAEVLRQGQGERQEVGEWPMLDIKLLRVAMSLGLGLALLVGCEQQGAAQKAGEKIDKAVEGAGKELQKAGEKAGEKLEEAGKKVKDASK